VSLRSLRTIAFLSELNGLQLIGLEIGNAYWEAYTKKKVFSDCWSRMGRVGRSYHCRFESSASGAQFYKQLADTLRAEGFKPSLADPDVWNRDAGDVWEYKCVYVDNLFAALRDPKAIADLL
jgi:hypothetical protein